MSESVVNHWRGVLLRLQTAEEEIKKTQVYTKDLELIQLLKELIKEQTPNENTDSAAS